MKYTSKKGTVINIPDGLTAKQIASIKADADAGYGTRAQQTADSLAKKTTAPINQNVTADRAPTVMATLQGRADAGTIGPKDQARLDDLKGKYPAANNNPGGGIDTSRGQTTSGVFQDPGGAITSGTVNKNGQVDSVAAGNNVSDAETKDLNTNFNLEHPQTITDQNGNTRTIIKNPDGTVTVKDTQGGTAKTFTDLATAAAQTFNGSVSRQNAYDAEFVQRTKYLDRNQARDEETAKQELANRGIPYSPEETYNPNTKNLYGRTIGGIKQNYQGQYADAANQATLAGNAAYATDASARDSFLNAVTSGASQFGGNFGQYTNTVNTDQSQDTKDLIALSSDAFLKKYGIDKDTYTKKLAINKPASGGGGGGSGDSSGFEIIG